MNPLTRSSTAMPIAAMLLVATAVPAEAQNHAPSATPIEVTVPFAPAPVPFGGARRLLYEFHLANYARGDIVLDEIQISNPASGARLEDIKGASLAADIYRPGPEIKDADRIRLAGGAVAVLYMETSLPADTPPPKTLAWRLTVSKPDASKASALTPALPPVEGEIAVNERAPIAIGFPFKGGDWVAGNGPSNTSGHRRALITVDGKTRIAQRFAIDWVKLGPDGRLFHGDKAINTNWYGFGTEVLAVADARVSASHDGVPENEPSDKRAMPITLDTVAGNYLILDLGEGRYALYAHMQPGSQKVRVGDRVHRGEVLGLLGNTGNSDAPHLHFHIADANSPLGAEGLPYVFDGYASLGLADTDKMIDAASAFQPASGTAPLARHAILPAENEVVRVP